MDLDFTKEDFNRQQVIDLKLQRVKYMEYIEELKSTIQRKTLTINNHRNNYNKLKEQILKLLED